MTSNLTLFSKIIDYLQTVILPNGFHQNVKHVGEVTLSGSLILENVLHLPSFKYNLLLVSALLRDQKITVVFTANYCYLQDKSTLKELAIG